ncbi:4Fe-4S dicluster domain-containing protein [Clostridium chauvoei]|uniref:4Fe-4S dicluster domain-containing protein n=1 Tax=Clostridium chauvoei TaxID=46867 RepID=UPI000BB677AF|nr:4Fe-4S dicluster domain-containing protein [Clostridium chauvoei]ATD55058.1 hypothetical protein BTM20_07325 [Clostridium chauvoei]
MELEDIKQLLKEKGIVGAGGAGFPLYAKLSKEVDTVILNAAECEPLFRVDRNILKEHSLQVLEGLNFIVDILDAKEGVVEIKEHYIEANQAIDNIISTFPRLKKKLLKDGYPAGDEVILTYETTGRVVPQGGIPLNVGIMVMNVETAFNVYNAVRKNNPVTHKYLTVSGAVNTPKTLYVPIGIKFKELIPEVNGINIEEYKLLVGGPMTGRIGNLNETVTKTTKGIFILPKDNPIIELKEYNLNSLVKRSMGTCSQCRMCTDLCPRNLVGHSIEPHKIMNSLIFGLDFNSEVFINALACCECNLCSAYACHQSLNPKVIISELKTKLREQGIKPRFNNEAIVKEEREYRRVPVKRVISRLKLSEFDKDAPIADIKDKPSILKINKKQSIGILVNTVVKIGDRVKKKDVIGVIDEKDLGVYLHSPIDGIIIDIDKDSISIRKEE